MLAKVKVLEDDMKRNNVDIVIQTNLANCVDCYKCVRVCPVKAIKVTEGQARIEPALCVECGSCVRVCPQGAKVGITTLQTVKDLIENNEKVACSIAPSFASLFGPETVKKVPTALRKLGFSYIGETAEGAEHISHAAMQVLEPGTVFTACPALVSYVEKYKTEYLPYLSPVVSPLIGHAKIMKKRLGDDVKVVFIGPCIAKKQEIRRPEYKGLVSEAITFWELFNWLEEEHIVVEELEESSFDGEGDFKTARMFPLQGGMLNTCGLNDSLCQQNILHISGFAEIKELFDLPHDEWQFDAVEPLFCKGGCIGGPAYGSTNNFYGRKKALLEYVDNSEQYGYTNYYEDIDLSTFFYKRDTNRSINDVSEEDIEMIFKMTGKENKEDRLDCGACGYYNCRDKAAAIYLGLAEASMCMPMMRKKAEKMADKILDASPNAIVIVDETLSITKMNNAFHKMFMCSDKVLGREISYIIDDENFSKASETNAVSEGVKNKYGVLYHEYVFRIENEIVGIFSPVKQDLDEDRIEELKRRESIKYLETLLSNQIDFAKKLTGALGSYSAENEDFLNKLLALYKED